LTKELKAKAAAGTNVDRDGDGDGDGDSTAIVEAEKSDAGREAREEESTTKTDGATASRTVVLDRSDGKKIGIRLGSAAGADLPITIKNVNPTGQAAGKLAEGDRVFAINGESVVGMTMKEAAPIVMKSDTVTLTLDAPIST
jgi:C-terminal processing protease CtpA/Prc